MRDLDLRRLDLFEAVQRLFVGEAVDLPNELHRRRRQRFVQVEQADHPARVIDHGHVAQPRPAHVSDGMVEVVLVVVDIQGCKIDNDQDYLYLNFALNIETNLQNGSGLELYVDTDNDPSTGAEYNGIGADLETN